MSAVASRMALYAPVRFAFRVFGARADAVRVKVPSDLLWRQQHADYYTRVPRARGTNAAVLTIPADAGEPLRGECHRQSLLAYGVPRG